MDHTPSATVRVGAGDGPPRSGPEQQPYLHDRVVLVLGPAVVVAGPAGGMGEEPDGYYLTDRRVLRRLELRAPGAELAPIGHHRCGPRRATFLSVVRGVGQHSPDPAVSLTIERTVEPDALVDRITVRNDGRTAVAFPLELDAAVDEATMPEVKSGRTRVDPLPALVAAPIRTGLRWRGRAEVEVVAAPAPERVDAPAARLAWEVAVPAGGRWEAEVRATARRGPAPLFAAARRGSRAWAHPEVDGDPRLARLLDTALGDLGAMLLCDDRPGHHDPDLFVAAGAPWYVTLFGRDSLWAARMLLPLGTRVAAGTLRVLGRRQGERHDPDREEQPGKILHELRAEGSVGEGDLPSTYFGTVDATPLWITLLRDAWRWGMPDAEVDELLAGAERALEWMDGDGDPDGDGFIEYATSGGGLANQGWRDSADAIRWHDGHLAEPPIALAEVQAYAHEAALAGAELLDAFGRPGADRWRSWAAAMRDRFHARFWIDTDGGPLPAVALDGEGRAVDSATSALGHLLGTGLLDDHQSAVVARRLTRADLHAGYGVRTLSSDATGFNPLGYHTGSIWPHDTAIAAAGLRRAGFPEAAWSLIDGLLDAAASFDHRLPELFAGHGRSAGPPNPYPAACRPQAWAAAAAVLALQTALGLEADVPAGVIRVDPLAGLPSGFAARNLAVAGGALGVVLRPGGPPAVSVPAGLTVARG